MIGVDRNRKRRDSSRFQPSLFLGSTHRVTGRCVFRLPQDLSEHVVLVANSNNFHGSEILFTIFQELIRRFLGQQSVTAAFQRFDPDQLVISSIEPCSTREFIQRVKAVSSDTDLHRNTNAVDAVFVFGEPQEKKLQIVGSNETLRCSLYPDQAGLRGTLEFDRRVWDDSIIRIVPEHYQKLLFEALNSLDEPIDSFNIISDTEEHRLDTWNKTAAEFSSLRADELFEQQVANAPDRPAVTFGQETLSYGELSARVDLLTERLRRSGVGPGTLIGICIERSTELVVALLAVFKAGAAYLPLDPAFPAERIKFMLADAQPLIIITQVHLKEKLSEEFKALLIGAGDMEAMEDAVASTESSVPTDLAYLLYTSGSTGKPKGVEISHAGLTNLLTSVSRNLRMQETDVFLAISTVSFDISVFEIFAPLVTGGQLVVAPRSVATSGELLASAIAQSNATIMQATPSGWHLLLEAGWKGKKGLKMLTAGEPLDRTLADRLLERGGELWNLYGPTEATIYATGRQITKGDKITIGKPLANYTAYVLDRNSKRMAIGAIGELYLGGIGLARGYRNREALTAEKFVTLSLQGKANRLYRTGDLARLLPNGEVELLGRIDNQIKLRGYRIELEEIESVLDSHPEVRRSIARVITLTEGDQRLIAYVAPQNSGQMDITDLRHFAQRALPIYMVPSAFISIELFPLTPSGKVDRKALPLPQAIELNDTPDSHAVADIDKLEDAVLDCWRAIIGADVGLDDDFFEAGGHSLLAARMAAQLSQRIGLRLPIGLLIEAPTPRKFANRIREIRRQPVSCLVPLQPKGDRTPIYFLHHLLGDVMLYRPVAELFAPDTPVIGIQAPYDLADRAELSSLEALAAEYIVEIQRRQPVGPYHLVGFSSGCLLAFEMACQLRKAGHEVGMVALIDGDVKAPGPSLTLAERYFKIFVRKMCKICFKWHDEVKEGPTRFITKRIWHYWLYWSVLLRSNSQRNNPQGLGIEQILLIAERNYKPAKYDGSVLLIRFHDEAWKYGPDPAMGWSTLVAGRLDVIDLPGGHITGMSDQGTKRLEQALKNQMQTYSQGPSRSKERTGTSAYAAAL